MSYEKKEIDWSKTVKSISFDRMDSDLPPISKISPESDSEITPISHPRAVRKMKNSLTRIRKQKLNQLTDIRMRL